jgi:hypothetical protein
MDKPPDLGSPISINAEGGFYKHGKEYSFAKKWEVASVFLRLWETNFPVEPTNMRELGRESNVSASYAKKVVVELTTTGCLCNPCITWSAPTSSPSTTPFEGPYA